jgi:hypothetical protein
LKSKRLISKEGEHRIVLGKEGEKIWFSSSNINQLLDPHVNQVQTGRLSDAVISAFNHEAASSLEFLGYQKCAR